jgi:hypothetical protein
LPSRFSNNIIIIGYPTFYSSLIRYSANLTVYYYFDSKDFIMNVILGSALALGLSVGVSSPVVPVYLQSVNISTIEAQYGKDQLVAANAATRLLTYYNDEQNRITKELVHIQSQYLAGGFDSAERKRLSRGLTLEIIFYRDRARDLQRSTPVAYLAKLGYVNVRTLNQADAKACSSNATRVSARPAIVTVKHRVEVKKAAQDLMRGVSKGSLSDSVGKTYNVKVAGMVDRKIKAMEKEVLYQVDSILAKCGITK